MEENCTSRDAPQERVAPMESEIDMAHKEEHAEFAVYLNDLAACRGSLLQIHYAMSHARLSQDNTTCDVLVEVTGELSEFDNVKTFNCSTQAVQEINWLQFDAPITQLGSSTGCRRAK